jgi:hypothetical protein
MLPAKWPYAAQDTFSVEPALMAAWHQPWCEAYSQERLEYGIVQFRRQYRRMISSRISFGSQLAFAW